MTVAYGLNTLQKDLKYGDLMDQMANNYKNVTTVVDKTDLLYAINSSVVTKKNEKNANLGAFKENVDKNLTNDRATQNIAVKGYASPDGPVKFNDTLSKKQAAQGRRSGHRRRRLRRRLGRLQGAGREVGHQGQEPHSPGVEPLQLARRA